MKLATLRDGTRDGTLAVVSDDLSLIVPAASVSRNLQIAIEHWSDAEPKLAALAAALNAGDIRDARPFDPLACESVLPRAYQFLDGSAYLNHVELVRRARGAEMPEDLRAVPLMYQAVSDGFLTPHSGIPVASADWGIDMEAEIGVIVDDVPMGIAAEDAGAHVKLVMLINDVSLRGLIPDELARGFGFLTGKPRSSLSPVAVSPDALGAAWDGGRLHADMAIDLNGAPIGRLECGTDMDFDFRDLIAHAAKTRPLAAGTIIGSGTVSNRDRGAGVACLAELRTIQQLDEGRPKTSFMQYGDRVRIEVRDGEGNSLFGAIEQEIVPHR